MTREKASSALAPNATEEVKMRLLTEAESAEDARTPCVGSAERWDAFRQEPERPIGRSRSRRDHRM